MPVSPPRDEYFPILYSTVSSKRVATLGTDFNSEPAATRFAGARRQHDRDGAGHLGAQSDQRDARGLSNRNLPGRPAHDTIEEMGVIVGAFQTVAVFDSILRSAKLPQTVDLYLYSAHAADGLPV